MTSYSTDELQFLRRVGERIQSYREQRAYGLGELARQTELEVGDLRAIESGRKSLYLSDLLTIARTLEVSPADLVRIDDRVDGKVG